MKTDGFVLQAILFEGAMALVGALLALFCGLDLTKALYVTDLTTLFTQLALGVGLFVGLGIVFSVLDFIPCSQLQQISEKTKEALSDTMKGTSHFNRFLVCLMAGVGEEILFRGFIFVAIFEFWPWGLEYNMNVIVAIAVSSILFGLGHSITTLYFFITGFLGAAFCLVFIWTGSLIAPIVAHTLYDFYAMEATLLENKVKFKY